MDSTTWGELEPDGKLHSRFLGPETDATLLYRGRGGRERGRGRGGGGRDHRNPGGRAPNALGIGDTFRHGICGLNCRWWPRDSGFLGAAQERIESLGCCGFVSPVVSGRARTTNLSARSHGKRSCVRRRWCFWYCTKPPGARGRTGNEGEHLAKCTPPWN